MSVTVRPAGRRDLPALLRLYAQLYPEVARPATVDDGAIWDAIEATPGRTVLVAEVAQGVVGTVDVSVVPNLPRRGEPVLLVENVVVDVRHRRTGAGRALLAAAEELGRAAGCYKLQLAAADEDAFRFYESVGLRPGGRVYTTYLRR
ncbi:GNAT family N-acetyltransferase [Cellulomonas sp.]|uniref:GNAT family N-acetyltransferase n=1 Tax=Cellulomonas sp. TaxID=40001 RepID=UPI00281268AF|nr:GNAT family N-acetyltransferase [Cellulomonas sp.]